MNSAICKNWGRSRSAPILTGPPTQQMDDSGNFTGIAADLLKLLSNSGLGYTVLVYIKARDWDEAVALVTEQQGADAAFFEPDPQA
jgi:hypothetical protein